MAIEDMSSSAWMEYRQRRLLEQNGRSAEKPPWTPDGTHPTSQGADSESIKLTDNHNVALEDAPSFKTATLQVTGRQSVDEATAEGTQGHHMQATHDPHAFGAGVTRRQSMDESPSPQATAAKVDKNTAAFARAQGHEDAATAADGTQRHHMQATHDPQAFGAGDETNLDESTAVVAPREERCADQGERVVDRLSSQAAVSEDAMKIDESTAVTMRGEENCADHGEQRGDHPTPHAESSEGAREQQSEAAPITEAATPQLMASNEEPDAPGSSQQAPVAMEVQQEGRGLKRRRSFDGGQKSLALCYKARGYPVFSASISWDAAKNKKVLRMPDRWQRCDLRNCLDSFFDPMEPAIMINTTTCDVVALDADVHDGGMSTLAELEREHGSIDAPRVRTGSGGLHIYFSYGKSLGAGLDEDTPTTLAKLRVGGEKVGIDFRGQGRGACLIAPPTRYRNGSGETCEYVCLGSPELPLVADLPAMPPWLCELLNQQKRAPRLPAPPRALRQNPTADGRPAVWEGNAPDLQSLDLRDEVVGALRQMLAIWGDHTSVFHDAKPSHAPGAVMYNFRNGPKGRDGCPYFPAGAGKHDSNHFGLQRRGAEIFYVCHSERCKPEKRRPPIKLGRLPFPVAAAFGDSTPLNSEQIHVYGDRELLPLSFLRENLSVAAGDEGGALILERIFSRTGMKIVCTTNGWFYWNGSCWQQDEPGEVQRVCREILKKVEAAFVEEETERLSKKEEQAGEGPSQDDGRRPRLRKKVLKGLANFRMNAKMANLMVTCRPYFYDSSFEALLNSKKDVLPAANGVIDLRTGALLAHHPRFMAGAKIACDYPATGLSTPLGAFGRFLEDIMHVAGDGGPEALAHLQRILGYGITGYTSNQIMLMMVGEGSAGKSLLLALIRKLLGPFYRDVSRDMIVNIKGQRPASKGAANPMEAGLKGVRVAVCEEASNSDTLNEAALKKLVGTEVITSRELYKAFVTFETTQLHILCTNELPAPESSWTIALQRRITMAYFMKRYFASIEDGYDPNNPLHGRADPTLMTKLSDPVNQAACLVFLVQGAVGYFQDGQKLLEMPARSREIMSSYQLSTDPFLAFLENSCIVGDYFAGSRELLEEYNNGSRKVDGKEVGRLVKIDASQLKRMMQLRGFEEPNKARTLGFPELGATRGYKGLRLKTDVELENDAE